jgi:hypothetical protein
MLRRVLALALAVTAASLPAAVADEARDARAAAREARKEAKQAEREAERILRAYDMTRDEDKRVALVVELDAVDVRGRIPALAKGLERRRTAGRLLCIGKLRAFGHSAVVPHLTRLATAKAPEEVRAAAHDAAAELGADYTRRWYEHLAANDLGRRRTLGLDLLGQMASPDSVPFLAGVLGSVGLEVHAQLARLSGFRTVPVNLGSAGNAATNVPIQLPATNLIGVHTKVQVPAELRAHWGGQAHAALKTIAGHDLGQEPDAWLAWYEEHKREREAEAKAKAKEAAGS